MAIEYYLRAVCDQCGKEIEPMTKVRGEADCKLQRWSWRDKWAGTGIMRGLQPMGRQAKLYCADCAGT